MYYIWRLSPIKEIKKGKIIETTINVVKLHLEGLLYEE